MQDTTSTDCHDNRGTAATYLARLARWQEANGGFRRIPTKATDDKLNNWIHRARFKFRHGTLNAEVAAQLKAMGALSDDADRPDGVRHDVYERAKWAVTYLREHGLDREPERIAQKQDIDPKLKDWIKEMRTLASKLPGCALLTDLRTMVPEFFKQKVEDALSQEQDQTRRRAERSPIELISGFISSQERLPDILADDAKERRLASWLIAIEHNLVKVDAQAEGSGPEVTALRRVRAALEDSKQKQRDAQWRWWSSVAMDLLRSKGVSGEWNERIHKEPPEHHATRMELDLEAAREGKPGWSGGPWGVDRTCVAMAIDRADGIPINPMRVLLDVVRHHRPRPGFTGPSSTSALSVDA